MQTRLGIASPMLSPQTRSRIAKMIDPTHSEARGSLISQQTGTRVVGVGAPGSLLAQQSRRYRETLLEGFLAGSAEDC